MLVFILMFILSLGFMMIFMISPFTGITYLVMQVNSHKRTEKGEELNKKIEGLKQYIRDYSLLSRAEKESLEIWQEYLIYSIIFDMNLNGIVDELSKLVEIKYEVGKIYIERVK